MRFETYTVRTDLFAFDGVGRPVARRHGEIRLRTDDGAEAYLAVAMGDTARVVADGCEALLGRMAAGPMPLAAVPSARYAPTAEQGQSSPLLAACAARGVTEREVIEHLFRENQRLTTAAARLAEMRAPATIVLGRDTFEPKERP